MADERLQRRLAAILAADVVGYSRLIELDEAGTLAVLKQRRTDILQPLVAEYRGRIIKVMGDGVLVEFASAVNAVACAVELQKRMTAANDGVDEDRRIGLRIGVNLGDVVVEGGDLYGDGVIVAVRLQTMAEPGGICVSASVHEQVENKLPLLFEDLGPCEVKNSARPVRALRVKSQGPRSERPTTHQAAQDRPAIAVLPFTDMSADPEQQYLADGITEDIIAELSRFSSLFVIARNSSFRYRNTSLDTKQIGRELGARYLVEGSVRRLGPKVRITAQVTDAITSRTLWAERYDRKIDELFALQDEVVRAVATTSEHRIADSEFEQVQRRPLSNWAAYDCLLQARHFLGHYGNYSRAETHLRRAIELDPNLAEAYAKLAHVAMARFWLGGGRQPCQRGVGLRPEVARRRSQG